MSNFISNSTSKVVSKASSRVALNSKHISKALKMLVFAGVCGVLVGVSACKDGSKGENSGLNSANSKDLSKYRKMYAKPTSEWAKPKIDPSVEDEWQEFAPIPRIAPAPADNEFVHTKAHLGRNLFNDPRLSKSGQFACESCHHKDLASADGLPRAYGHDFQTGRRNTPSTQMAGFFDELFWDGRAKSLEEQVLGPITDPVEMANTLENAERAIKNAPEYYPLFVAAFGDETLKGEWARFYEWIAPKTPQEEEAAKKTIHTHKPEDENATAASSNANSAKAKANNSANSANANATANSASNNTAAKPKNEDLLGIERLGKIDSVMFDELKDQEKDLFRTSAYRRLLSDKGASQTADKSPQIPQSLINEAKKLITIENIAKAIATFERGPGIMSARNTRFQRFLGGDYAALSDKELWGLDIFRNKGQCMNCHYGFLMSDKKFHNVGLDLYGRVGQDLGRYEVTREPADIGAFKTPTLVNVAKTAPYMHGGSSPNLKGVIQLFNAAFPVPEVSEENLQKGLANANVAGSSEAVKSKEIVKDKDGKLIKPVKSPLIQPLNLSADEIEALEAFLRTL